MYMVKLASYFLKEKNRLIPENKYIVKGQNYRFSVLTPRLIRLEYNDKGIFEDRATSLVTNRKFDDLVFNVSGDQNLLVISTEYFTLKYAKGAPFSSKTIKVG